MLGADAVEVTKVSDLGKRDHVRAVRELSAGVGEPVRLRHSAPAVPVAGHHKDLQMHWRGELDHKPLCSEPYVRGERWAKAGRAFTALGRGRRPA